MKSTIVLLSIIFATSLSVAQDTTASAKLDSVLLNQKKMMELQKIMYEEVRYVDPLAKKTFGIEFNPGYFLLATTGNYTVLSGGFSLFAVDRGAEIAFPVFYKDGIASESDPLKLFTIDAIYRRFLGAHQDGLYFSVGLRYAYIDGRGDELGGVSFGILHGDTGDRVVQKKLGAHFGIGYRYFTRSGFYWGASVFYGRYFGADERTVHGAGLDDSKVLLDVEILKFGFAF